MDSNLIFDEYENLNGSIDDKFVNKLLSCLDIELENKNSLISLICKSNKNNRVYESANLIDKADKWYFVSVRHMMHYLCNNIAKFIIVSFGYGDNKNQCKIVLNPYLGCKTIDELLIKKDLALLK